MQSKLIYYYICYTSFVEKARYIKIKEFQNKFSFEINEPLKHNESLLLYFHNFTGSSNGVAAQVKKC